MSRRYLPKDGLLRTESSAAHAVTARRRDKIVEELKEIYSVKYVVETAGSSIIRILCDTPDKATHYEELLRILRVNETHLTKWRNNFCVIGVVL